ncbi:MAG: hypothetical protein KIT37_02975 [Steroidobacteraceae bacterium]|nr:hypothetical protein [Steroidobacteraceae bacterium]
MRRDARDAPSAGAAEVAVVREHAPGARGILLFQQQLQRLFAADHVGTAQLAGERALLRGERGLVIGLLARQRGAARRALAALAPQPRELTAGFGHRDLGRAQVAGELVAVDRIALRLGRNLRDFGLDRLQVGLGPCGILRLAPGDGAAGEDAGVRHEQYEAKDPDTPQQ